MTYRWAIKLVVTGDARFASHHDMLRAIERIATRAKLPLHYTQGFNPHIVMSLTCPRPVGVASLHDLLCLALDSELSRGELLEQLNTQSVPGLEFVDAHLLPTKTPPQPESVEYKLDLTGNEIPEIEKKLSALNSQDSWEIERKKKSKRRGKPDKMVTIDIKPRISELQLDSGSLKFTLVGDETGWAKPTEVMSLVGLAGHENTARLTRTDIKYKIHK